jgi:hypothetical protein
VSILALLMLLAAAAVALEHNMRNLTTALCAVLLHVLLRAGCALHMP